MVITQNEQQKPQLTGWAYLYRNTVHGNKLGYSQLKNDTFERVEEGFWEKHLDCPRRSPHISARLVSLTHFLPALETKMAQICFSLKNIETVLRERQTVYVPLLFMNDSAGTIWNRDSPLLPPHPEGAWSWRCTPGGLGRALVLCLSLSDCIRKWEVERYWIMNDFYLTVHRWEREALN